jgi:ABC-2 type transport system permease protein
VISSAVGVYSVRELVLGTLLSREGLVVATLFPLLLAAEGRIAIRLGGLYLGAALAWVGATLLLGVVWTGASVRISAAVSSRYRSLAVLVATSLLFSHRVGLWNPVVRPAIAFVATGRVSTGEFVSAVDRPAWFRYADHLTPFVAFSTVREGLLEATGYGTQFTELVVPLFLYSAGILVLFVALTVFLGTRRFERVDF